METKCRLRVKHVVVFYYREHDFQALAVKVLPHHLIMASGG